MDVASLLARARHRSGLTIRQLACRAGTSHSAVAAYESGAKAPNTSTLDRLVRACGFEIESRLRPLSPFEDRARRGRDPAAGPHLARRFPGGDPSPIRARVPGS